MYKINEKDIKCVFISFYTLMERTSFSIQKGYITFYVLLNTIIPTN